MFGFFKKKADVMDHWIAFVEGFELVPSEFYASVEKELQARDVPGMQMSRIEFSEGGIVSGKRTYLRMLRERLVFDVCAAPFGKSFFFSCRFAEIPAVPQWWQLLVLISLLGFLALLSLVVFSKFFGLLTPIFWPLAWLILPIFAIYVMRNSVAMGLQDLDRMLIRSPVLGPIYEAWIRKETYHRQDTRLMYLEIVSGVVKSIAEEAVALKGLKLLRQYECKPVLRELYKPVPTSTPQRPPDLTPHEFGSRTNI